MRSSNYFPIKRNRYYYGKLLTVRDFELEQNYYRSKNQLDNRVMQGAGVVCGLSVSASDDTTLLIESGMALDYQGREIVLEEPLVRKLQMLDGYDSLGSSPDGYLCLSYQEENIEPVNAVGSEVEASRQFNMTQEGYRLFLTSEKPDYRQLLEASGEENVNIIYSSDALTLVLSCPSAVCAGEEFLISALVVRTAGGPPVHFTLEGENAFAESENGRISLEYSQSPAETRQVIRTTFRFRAQNLSGITGQLFPSGAELNVELGPHQYKNYISLEIPVMLCADQVQMQGFLRRRDSLNRRMAGAELPIYLAKLELIHSTGGVFLNSITDLPFGQYLRRDGSGVGAGRGRMDVTTNVRKLDYWQQPEVHAVYNSELETLAFDFGIPTPEQYDYSVTHGVVDMELPGGIRVNGRYFSEEFPHGLGVGAVDVRLSVEFQSGADTLLLMGNSEVFKSRHMNITPPFVETAALIYPERGTMRIGVWLHDNVPGNRLRVHYFAQRPERDTSRMMEQNNPSVQVMPEVARLGKGERLRMKAIVEGSADKTVVWSVKDENGGEIDQNGIYQAPEVQGTYEIVATSSADPAVKASAFVIVE